VGVEHRRHVRCEEGDAVAALDPGLLEREREPPRPLPERGVAEPRLPVDDGGPLRERQRAAFQERERGERGEMDGLRGDTVRRMAVSGTTFRGVRIREEGPAATITLDRPEKRNALSLELMQEVIEALRLAGESRARAIVIEGAGPAFSAGHDLGEMIGREPAFYRELFDVCTVMMESIHRLRQPVIAKVHGIATAAGCQLVAACDLAVAAEGTRFATPGVKIGLFCSTPMVPVSRAVGRKRALELLLTGEPIDAATALDWGLVNRVVPADRLDGEVADLVAAIARSSADTICIGKRAFYDQIDLDESGAYDLTKDVMASNSQTEDAQEGMSAFLEKRAPVWRD
jgi:enoyl-CoA hydratase/carnithine racemase